MFELSSKSAILCTVRRKVQKKECIKLPKFFVFVFYIVKVWGEKSRFQSSIRRHGKNVCSVPSDTRAFSFKYFSSKTADVFFLWNVLLKKEQHLGFTFLICILWLFILMGWHPLWVDMFSIPYTVNIKFTVSKKKWTAVSPINGLSQISTIHSHRKVKNLKNGRRRLPTLARSCLSSK